MSDMNEKYMNYRFRGSVLGRSMYEGHVPTIGGRTGDTDSGLVSHTHGMNCGIEVKCDTVKGEQPLDWEHTYGVMDRFHVFQTTGSGHRYHNPYGGEHNKREWLLTLYGDGRIRFPEPVVLIPDPERPTEFALHALVNVVRNHFDDKDPTDVPHEINEALQEATSAMAGRILRYDRAEGSPRR